MKRVTTLISAAVAVAMQQYNALFTAHAGVPAAAGHPQYSGTFIPEIWSGKLVEKFYDATVFGEIANTDYEGEIANQGDKVNIRTTPDITIRDYQKGSKLQYERPESPNVSLLVDKAKYFAFTVDAIDKYQSDIALIDDWSGSAGEQMKIAVDTDILGNIYADVHADNKGVAAGRKSHSYNLGAVGAPYVLTPANVIELITGAASVADEQNWPETGRWMVIPAWMRFVLMNSDLKNASLTGDERSILRNGRIGMVDRFMLYMSNNLAVTPDGGNQVTNVLFGHKAALTFASQMTQMETLKAESTFGDLVRGLNVYGYEVIKEDAMGLIYARKG